MSFIKRTDSYFHVTTWPRDSFEAGGMGSTPLLESVYWQNKQNIDLMEQTNRAILGGNLANSILEGMGANPARSKAVAEAAKERLFEKIRATEFPNLPSRRKCMFLCESEDQIRSYISTHGFDQAGRTIIELNTVYIDGSPAPETLRNLQMNAEQFEEYNACNRFRANPKFLNCNSLSPTEQGKMARAYWHGDDTDAQQLTEVLYVGLIKVIRKLDW